MKYLTTVGGLLIALVVASITRAEIYQSEDARGNPVFSDTPSPGAVEVELRPGNIADAPAEMPGAATEEAEATVPAAEVDDNDAIVIIEDGDSDPLEGRVTQDERREILEAEERREVSDAEPRREIGPAKPRREVPDADTRREVEDAQQRREIGEAEPRHSVGQD